MRLRTSLVATVVGALVIGGAATGTTLALWRDQAAVASSQVKAGELTISVKNEGETSTALPAITGLTPGGEPVTVRGVIRNTSPAAAKNLRINVGLSQLAVATLPQPTSSFTLANLRIDVRRMPTGGCPILTAAQLSNAQGYNVPVLNEAAMTANLTVPICVSVAAASSMPSGQSGHLAMIFRGVQVP